MSLDDDIIGKVCDVVDYDVLKDGDGVLWFWLGCFWYCDNIGGLLLWYWNFV